IDYLVKPVDTTELIQAVDRVEEKQKLDNAQINGLQNHFNGVPVQKLAISSQQGVSFVSLDQIIYIEADSNYSTISLTTGKSIVISKTLKDLQDLLEDSHFLRIHRHYIINLNHVELYDRTRSVITMVNKKEVSISRNIKEKLAEMYLWL
ncbi:MAG: LytR/AlgR family response regulator transcription factor, partial [Mucilaginibacter sp.]